MDATAAKSKCTKADWKNRVVLSISLLVGVGVVVVMTLLLLLLLLLFTKSHGIRHSKRKKMTIHAYYSGALSKNDSDARREKRGDGYYYCEK